MKKSFAGSNFDLVYNSVVSKVLVIEGGRDLCLVSAEVTLKKKALLETRKKSSFLGRSRPVRPSPKPSRAMRSD
jgi:hypothetical protein